MLIKTTGGAPAAGMLALAALAFLAALVPLASAADSFIALDCPLLAGSVVTASYYEDGVAKCAGLELRVTAPSGSALALKPSSCKDGVHSFPRFEARERGEYAINAVAPKAAASCTGAGVAVQRRKVPEMHPAVAVLAGLAGLLLVRKRFIRHGSNF